MSRRGTQNMARMANVVWLLTLLARTCAAGASAVAALAAVWSAGRPLWFGEDPGRAWRARVSGRGRGGHSARFALSLPTADAESPEYIGCFVNDGADRLTARATDQSWDSCLQRAADANLLYFGLENPQDHSTAGHAECLATDPLPPLELVADSECEAEPNVGGKRLGGNKRLALYKRGGACCASSGSRTVSVVPPWARLTAPWPARVARVRPSGGFNPRASCHAVDPSTTPRAAPRVGATGRHEIACACACARPRTQWSTSAAS